MADNTSLLQSDVLLGLLENLEPQEHNQSSTQGGNDTFETLPAQDDSFTVVGPSTEELESLKELIRFDHEYIKTTPVAAPIPSPIMNVKREKILSYQAIQPKPQERPIDLDDSVIDFNTDNFPTASVFHEKAEAALQDMLVSLKDASLSINTQGSPVPNLLSIDDDRVFDCDISDLFLMDSNFKNSDTKSEAGLSEDGSCVDSAFSETPSSPFSDDLDISPNLGDSIWEESFTHLFPSLGDF